MMLGLKPAPLGIGEPLFGKIKCSQVNEGLTDVFEAILEMSCQWSQGRICSGTGSDYRDWIGQQRGTI